MNRLWLTLGLVAAVCACDSGSTDDKAAKEAGSASSAVAKDAKKAAKKPEAKPADGSIAAPKPGDFPKPVVGGWVKYDVKSPSGGGTAKWQLVERRKKSEWLMDAVIDFKMPIGVQAWLDAPGWEQGTEQHKKFNAVEVRVKMPTGGIQTFSGARMAAVRKIVGTFMTDFMPPKFDGLPQEDVTVKAGTFRGCYRWKTKVTFMGQTTESTIWTHPALPVPAMVKTTAKNGTSYELTEYGLTGAKLSF